MKFKWKKNLEEFEGGGGERSRNNCEASKGYKNNKTAPLSKDGVFVLYTCYHTRRV